jgi:hypothetical protein
MSRWWEEPEVRQDAVVELFLFPAALVGGAQRLTQPRPLAVCLAGDRRQALGVSPAGDRRHALGLAGLVRLG